VRRPLPPSVGALVTIRSAALAQQVPSGTVHGYDLESPSARARLCEHRQREEIRTALAHEHGLTLSTGAISALTRRFVVTCRSCTRSAPRRSAPPRGRRWLPLHIDATGEDGRGTLFMAYAGSRQWVLGAWKLATERAELILPCLRRRRQPSGRHGHHA